MSEPGHDGPRQRREVRRDVPMSTDQEYGRAPKFRKACVPMGDHDRCYQTIAGRPDLPCMCPCHESRNGHTLADTGEILDDGSRMLAAIALDTTLSPDHRTTLAKVYRGLVALEH
jgi:hypothetical protein